MLPFSIVLALILAVFGCGKPQVANLSSGDANTHLPKASSDAALGSSEAAIGSSEAKQVFSNPQNANDEERDQTAIEQSGLTSTTDSSTTDSSTTDETLPSVIEQVKANAPEAPADRHFRESFDISLNGGPKLAFKEFRYSLNEIAPPSCDDGLSAQKDTVIQIPVGTNVILNAIACDQDGQASAVMTRNYIYDITPPSQPSISPSISDESSFTSAFHLTLTSGREQDFKEFRYTLDGSGLNSCTAGLSATPNTEIKIPAVTTTIKAIACDQVDNASSVTSKTYTYTGPGWSLGVTTTNPNDIMKVNIAAASSFSIDWGDGIVTSDINGSTQQQHTYATAGSYTMTLKGTASQIDFKDSPLLLTDILTPVQGIDGLTAFTNTFLGSSNLKIALPANLFANTPQVTDFSHTFRSSGITGTIPEDLFAKTPLATKFVFTFQKASGLTGSIPAGLFAHNPLAQSFQGTFMSATNLEGIESSLFANNPAATNFQSTFLGATGLRGNTPELWNTYPEAASRSCFSGAINLANYNDIPTSWK